MMGVTGGCGMMKSWMHNGDVGRKAYDMRGPHHSRMKGWSLRLCNMTDLKDLGGVVLGHHGRDGVKELR
jgi:hypothetical protein